jgi:aerobic-type carbon monoxide dehydrogenase small subunit (CoxS/CutS family)
MSANKNIGGITRRGFLKKAGLAVGAAVAGTAPMVQSCAGSPDEETVTITAIEITTVTVTPGKLVAANNSVHLNINNRDYYLSVKPDWTLDFVLRDKLGLFGTKVGCGMGDCGSCTVLSEGTPVLSCLLLAVECEGLRIETIEGLSDGLTLHPLQQKFFDAEAFQCGFCTPGFIMAAKALLASNPNPSVDEVREALSGHICTCGNFTKTVQAVAGGI